MRAAHGRQGRLGLVARIAGQRAAVGEDAAWDVGTERRERAGDRVEPVGVLAHAEPWRAPQERQRVRMARVGKELAGRALLDEAAGVEDPDALAHPRDDAQIVADEEDRGVEALAQLLDQVEHLGLDRRVEPGRRLVEHEQVGVGCKRHREHHPLLLAARELVRIASEHAGRIGDLHRLEHARGGVHGLAALHPAVELVHLGDLVPDPDRRVERRAGILVDHRHPVAAPAPQRLRRGGEQVVAGEPDAAALDDRVRRQVAHERHRHRRLAAARLADEPVRLAGTDRERQVGDHAQRPAPAAVADGEAVDLDGRGGRDGHSSTT